MMPTTRRAMQMPVMVSTRFWYSSSASRKGQKQRRSQHGRMARQGAHRQQLACYKPLHRFTQPHGITATTLQADSLLTARRTGLHHKLLTQYWGQAIIRTITVKSNFFFCLSQQP